MSNKLSTKLSNKLSQEVLQLETRASECTQEQCSELCFLENCDKCKAGCLYQAGVLRYNASLLRQPMPPLPSRLYFTTIQQLERAKIIVNK